MSFVRPWRETTSISWLPEDLKSKIEDAAARNRRSMTSEIIVRLESTFSREDVPADVRASLTSSFTSSLHRSIRKRLVKRFVKTLTISE
ncbi:Arc family DNA-binding protein [Sinorhizobium medicae]